MIFFLKEILFIILHIVLLSSIPLTLQTDLSFEIDAVLYFTKILVFTSSIANLLVLSAIQTRENSTNVIMNSAKSIGYWITCIPFFHMVAVLMGAPAFNSCTETFYFAALLSTCAVLPCSLVVGTDPDALIVLFTRNKSAPGLESIVKFSSIGSLLGAWLGAIPIPLDWDRPWQVWPISCMIGTVAGYMLGSLVGLLYSFVVSRSQKKRL